MPQLPGYYRRVSHPLDLTGATAATLCTYTRTSGSYEYAAFTFKQRLPVSATQLQQLIAALNEAEPFNLSMAYCPLGTPKAVAIYLRESTGIVSLMTGGGPSCGPLIANGLTLTTRYLTSVLADIGY